MQTISFQNIPIIFSNYMKKNFFTCGVCLVSVNGETVFANSYGTINRYKKKPCNINTIFDIASITKIVTTTIIFKLITENALSLHTTLKKCLPGIRQNSVLESITIKELLSHSSGLRAWHSFYAHRPQDDLFTILNEIELTHNQKQKVVYSDLNYILLGEVIKQHFQTSLQDVLDHQIVEPLGLRTLTYNPKYKDNIAATEFGNQIEQRLCENNNLHYDNWRTNDLPIVGEVNDGNAFYYFNGESGHAGLFSDVADLVAIGELYAEGGIHKGKELISKHLIDESLKEQIENRGLGWELTDIYPRGAGHTGFTGTALWVEPEERIVVGLLTNRLHVNQPANIQSFRKEVFEEVLKD